MRQYLVSIGKILDIVIAFSELPILKIWRLLSQVFKVLIPSPHPQGLYEVLEHHVRLELCDVNGHKAIYTKR
jgi:hypothetical protein